MAEMVSVKKSSGLSITLAWAIVTLPLLWGLDYTVRNALKIFIKPAATASAPAAASPK